MTFTAIDFETAHPKRWSICQVGLVRVEEGKIVKKVSMLIQPLKNFYWDWFIDIHGITPAKTRNAPTFDRVWHELKPFIQDEIVVAHNIGFDAGCLAQTLEYYDLAQPTYERACTLKIYKKKLNIACAEHGIPLKHHDALSDAEGCAELYRRWAAGK